MHPVVQQLVEQARQETDLVDLGDERCLEGLEVYVQTLEHCCPDENGKNRLLKIQYKKLLSRLKIFEALKQHPEIRDENIVAPLFVTGLPRSGTSALLNALAQDPDARPLAQWELRHPEPYPGLKPGEPDPRYLAVVEKMAALEGSEFRKIHYADADTPEECVMLHQLSFDGVQTGFEIMFEPYHSWFLNRDLHWMYEEYKLFLKVLQWQRPGKRWVLKAPAHMWAIDVILDLFPDAAFVWGHRDPVGVTSSISSMNQQVMRMYMGDTSHLDQNAVAKTVMDFYAQSLERGLAMRQKHDARHFMDYNHKEFIARPLQLIERVFNTFGHNMRPDQRSAFVDHINNHPQHKHGKHEYTLEDFGLTEAMIRERFAFYTFKDNYSQEV